MTQEQPTAEQTVFMVQYKEDQPCMQVLGNVRSTAQVHPEKLTKAMMAAAESRGAKVVIGSVQSIVTGDSPAAKVTGTCTIALSHCHWSHSSAGELCLSRTHLGKPSHVPLLFTHWSQQSA